MRLDDDTLRRIFKGRVLDGLCVNRHLRDVLSKAGSADYPLRLHLTDRIEGYSTVAAVFVNAQFGVPNTAVAQLLPAAAVHVDMTERDVRDLIADRYWTSDPARFGGELARLITQIAEQHLLPSTATMAELASSGDDFYDHLPSPRYADEDLKKVIEEVMSAVGMLFDRLANHPVGLAYEGHGATVVRLWNKLVYRVGVSMDAIKMMCSKLPTWELSSDLVADFHHITLVCLTTFSFDEATVYWPDGFIVDAMRCLRRELLSRRRSLAAGGMLRVIETTLRQWVFDTECFQILDEGLMQVLLDVAQDTNAHHKHREYAVDALTHVNRYTYDTEAREKIDSIFLELDAATILVDIWTSERWPRKASIEIIDYIAERMLPRMEHGACDALVGDLQRHIYAWAESAGETDLRTFFSVVESLHKHALASMRIMQSAWEAGWALPLPGSAYTTTRRGAKYRGTHAGEFYHAHTTLVDSISRLLPH